MRKSNVSLYAEKKSAADAKIPTLWGKTLLFLALNIQIYPNIRIIDLLFWFVHKILMFNNNEFLNEGEELFRINPADQE